MNANLTAEHQVCSWCNLPGAETELGGQPIHIECVAEAQGGPGEEMSPEEAAYYEAEAARGDLAGVAHDAECYDCGRAAKKAGEPYETDQWDMPYITREIVALGPVIEERRDPTQTYKLACGHTAI